MIFRFFPEFSKVLRDFRFCPDFQNFAQTFVDVSFFAFLYLFLSEVSHNYMNSSLLNILYPMFLYLYILILIKNWNTACNLSEISKKMLKDNNFFLTKYDWQYERKLNVKASLIMWMFHHQLYNPTLCAGNITQILSKIKKKNTIYTLTF